MFAQLALAAALGYAPSVDQVLDNVREAVGYSELAEGRGVQLMGSANYVGMDTTFHYLFGPQGQYNMTVDGRLGQVQGWDGAKGWEADYSGATSRVHLEGLELQHALAWTAGHRWLDPNGPYKITLSETESGGDSYTLNLQLQGGRLSQTMVIDEDSWLPRVTRFDSSIGKHAVFFKEWKRTGHGTFPLLIETEDVGQKGSFKIEQVTAMPVFKRSPFVMPTWSVDEDTKYDSSKEGRLLTERARTGHIMVKPTIDGKDVGWFILDSGSGGMVVDTATAKKLGGEQFGEIIVAGVGGVSTSGYYEFDGFKLGPATVDGLLFIDIDLSSIGQALGIELGGIVGYDFFRRVTANIDMDSTQVSLYDPREGGADIDAEWMTLLLDNRHPTIEAEFEGGHKGRFRIDTGANGTVTFNRPTVVEHDMLNGRETQNSRQGGVNGFVDSKTGRIEYFEMAGKRWNDVQAVFPVSNEGIHGGAYLDGNLGQGLLRVFKIVLDYPNERFAMIKKE